MAIVTVHTAKTTLSKLIERAESGEDIVIARGNQPAVRLIPITPTPKRQFGLYQGLAKIGPEFFDPLPDGELDAWEGR
jgi:prevent-host-death family protein